MTGSQFIANTLKDAGADTVYGVPSYVGMWLIEALDAQGFDVILNTHEQNAGHMAEGHYLATGKLSVVSLAIGPGVTNAITGITQAFVDSIPMVILAGQANPYWWGRNEYHSHSGIGRNLNESQLLQSCTKAALYCHNSESFPQIVLDAVRTATTDRPGPVYLSIPVGLQTSELSNIPNLTTNTYLADNKVTATKKDIKLIESEFSKSTKPIVMIGGEVSKNDRKILKELLDNNCPYLTSHAGKGKVPILPNYLGTAWYSNSKHLSEALNESDLILVLGDHLTHFTGRIMGGYATDLPIIQVSEYQEEIGRAFTIQSGIHANASDLLSRLKLPKKPWSPTTKQASVDLKSYSTLSIIRQLGDLAPANTVFFADVGDAGYCSITDLKLRKDQDFFTTGKFGTCGYSIPTAIGHAQSDPTRPVVSIVGDLSINMNPQEMATAAKYNTPNTFLVFNNQIPQNITQGQEEVGRLIQSDIASVDYSSLAKAYGLDYYLINSLKDLNDFFTTADLNKSTNLVEIKLKAGDYPLVE